MLDPEDCKEVDSSTGSDTAGAWDDVEGGLCACWAIELNLKAMAATAWSLPLLPATPADPLQVKLKWCAGLLLVLQEVAGIVQGTRLQLVTQVVLPRIHAEGRVAGLSMTSCHQQPNSVSWHAAEGRRPKPPGPERMAAWIAIMALDHSRLGLENKFLQNKSGRIFLRLIGLLYKFLPTTLGLCKPTFYNHIWGETVLFIIQTSDRVRHFTIFQDKLYLVNIQNDQSWAFSKTVRKKFQNHPYGQPALISSASCQCGWVFE